MFFTNSLLPFLTTQSFSFIKFSLILFVILVFIITAWIITKEIHKYKNTEQYLENQKNKITSLREIKFINTKYNIPMEQLNILWEYCKVAKVPNILFIIKDNIKTNKLFEDAYKYFITKNISDKKMNLFFQLHYSLELINAQSKKLISTRQIPLNTILFYLTAESEKLPFTLIKQTNDYLAVEVPDFFVSARAKPEVLSRARFVFKTQQGLTHYFIARIMRYQKDSENKSYMLISHSENLVTQTQRHYKREMFDEKCFFSPAKIDTKKPNGYFISEKKYGGVLSNISGGGCCIKTNLPIRENQHLCVEFPTITGHNTTIIGIIKRTRRLPDNNFALHIQFLNISLASQNKILAFVYKYVL